MSRASKVTLTLSCALTASVIGYVHLRQVEDREKLHRGIIRDEERQMSKKMDNLYRLQQQQEIEKSYRERRDD